MKAQLALKVMVGVAKVITAITGFVTDNRLRGSPSLKAPGRLNQAPALSVPADSGSLGRLFF